MTIPIARQCFSIGKTSHDLPPVFLAPLLAPNHGSRNQRSGFSTTTSLCARKKHYVKTKDGNRHRGESALRRTGLRFKVEMSHQPLPQPVLDPKRRSKVQGDQNHGLWGFFNRDRKPLTTPKDEFAFGRPWAVEELRRKSWEDLHSLWYTCAKDKNRMATEARERSRLEIDVGGAEAYKRRKAIARTQQRIKHTLTERWYAWEEAWKVAENDPEVNLNAEPDTTAYTPRAYEEDVHENAEEEEEAPRAASSVG